jgi:hemoglobin
MKTLFKTTTLALALGLSPLTAQAGEKDALYQQLGGTAGITEIVSDLFDYIDKNPRIAPMFENSNKDRIEKLLVEQICDLSGGPCTYSGMDMKRSHTGLGITNMHFNAMVEDLQKAMDDNKVPFRTQNKLLAILAPMLKDMKEDPLPPESDS